MSQKVWLKDGSLGEEPNISREDLTELQRWKRKTMDCPFCLLRVTLDRFATFIQGTKKYPKKLSRKTMKCPGCRAGMRIDTLIKCTNQTVEEFAYWFWENAFLYRGMERTDGDNFFARIKLWRYEDRQIFWSVYHEYKDVGDKQAVAKDREDYERYAALGEGRVCPMCDTVLTPKQRHEGECPQCGEPIKRRGGEGLNDVNNQNI